MVTNFHMPTVTFDTNVIEFVLDPTKMERAPYRVALSPLVKEAYLELHRLIRDGKIQGCVSRTYFSYEAIRKNDRRDALISGLEFTIPRLSFYERTLTGAKFVQTKRIQLDGQFKWYLERMRRYGVKVLWNDRKLWPIVPDLKDEDYFTCDEDDFNARQCEAARVVEGELGAGFSIFEQELRKFRGDMTCPLQLLLVQRNEDKNDGRFFEKDFPAFVGEASDGDMVISHYAHRCDYLCTNDRGKGISGSRSIFAPNNVEQIGAKLGVKVVTPLELLDFLRRTF